MKSLTLNQVTQNLTLFETYPTNQRTRISMPWGFLGAQKKVTNHLESRSFLAYGRLL